MPACKQPYVLKFFKKKGTKRATRTERAHVERAILYAMGAIPEVTTTPVPGITTPKAKEIHLRRLTPGQVFVLMRNAHSNSAVPWFAKGQADLARECEEVLLYTRADQVVK